MRLTIKGVEFEILGDPHLGRPFRNGVPLHRQGEREAMQRADFQASIARSKGVDFHVCMGDLFDRVSVPLNIIWQAAEDYKAMNAEAVCLAGNHDISRDRSVMSSFELWAHLVDGVRVPIGAPVVRYVDRGQGVAKFGFIPWHPTKTALEVVEEHAEDLANCDAVFGHYDVVAIHNTENLIPAAKLKEIGVKLAITGHDHLAREIELEGLPIIVTGSMQPYSHSEDPEERLYVTRRPDQLVGEDFTGKCLRVVLKPGEVVDEVPDCLQFTTITVEEEQMLERVDVGFEAFDFNALWDQAFEGVDPAINQHLREAMREFDVQ